MTRMMRRMNRWTALAVTFLLSLGLWWAAVEGPLRSPEAALEDFFAARQRMEVQLMDPLILNGGRVIPLVRARVADPHMKLRRYAIKFLGNARDRAAIPVLERILADDSEHDYFRADALSAVFQVSPDRARAIAPRHAAGTGQLGRVAKDIGEGRDLSRGRRTFLQALLDHA